MHPLRHVHITQASESDGLVQPLNNLKDSEHSCNYTTAHVYLSYLIDILASYIFSRWVIFLILYGGTMRRSICAAALATVLTGCVSDLDPGYPFRPTTPRDVLVAIRCEFSEFISQKRSDFFPPGKSRWTIQGSLEVQTTLAAKDGFGLNASLVPLGGPSPKFDLGIGFEAGKKSTRKSNLKFSLLAKEMDKKECALRLARFGLAEWLASVAEAQQNSEGLTLNPRAYEFGLTFGVTDTFTGSLGVGFSVVPVSIDAKTLSQREDVQLLTIAIAPVPGKETTRIVIVPDEDTKRTIGEKKLLSSGIITRSYYSRQDIAPDLSGVLEQQRRELLGLE